MMCDLTRRQHQILALIAEGASNDEISARLGIGLDTTKTHVRALLNRMGAKNRAHAVANGFRAGTLT